MTEIVGVGRAKNAALIVTSATSLGFGGGALATGISLGIQRPSLLPASYIVLFIAAPSLAVVALGLPRVDRPKPVSLLRLPVFPTDTWMFGAAMALAWSTTGMTIAVIPLELAANDLGGWTGLVIFLAIFVGFLCQPIARRMTNDQALSLGFVLIPLGFCVLLVGVWLKVLAFVFVGTCITSAASYGSPISLHWRKSRCARRTTGRGRRQVCSSMRISGSRFPWSPAAHWRTCWAFSWRCWSMQRSKSQPQQSL